MQHIVDLMRRDELFPQYEGLISARTQNDLVILNYTAECQYNRAWDEVTLNCRGLIVDTRNWEIAARPFPKFFNLGEREETKPENLPNIDFSVYEKLDGSLGILYRDRAGKPRLSTRGSFESEQAIRGTEMLHKIPGVKHIPKELTLLFEIVYDESLSVIRYDFEGLVLLGAYNRFTSKELSWEKVKSIGNSLNIRLPKVHSFGKLEEAASYAKKLEGEEKEGVVIRFENGMRVKVKSESYCRLHRIIWSVSPKSIHEALVEGTYDDILAAVPEEHRPRVEEIAQPMIAEARELRISTEQAFREAPKDTRKGFALWVKDNVPQKARSAMFRLLDGKEVNWFSLISYD